MDRETAVRMWHKTTLGCPTTGRTVELFAAAVEAEERERCAQYLRAAADKLAPDGRRRNAADQHTARVLATMADEIAAGL